jgi:transcriptional regulator with XRE-family HTH domain
MPDAYEAELAIRLRLARQKTGLTQGQVAAALGVTSQSVSNWERAVQPPSPTHLQRLSGLYGMTPRQLIDLDDDNPILTAKTMRLVKILQGLPEWDQALIHRLARELHRRWQDSPFQAA